MVEITFVQSQKLMFENKTIRLFRNQIRQRRVDLIRRKCRNEYVVILLYYEQFRFIYVKAITDNCVTNKIGLCGTKWWQFEL